MNTDPAVVLWEKLVSSCTPEEQAMYAAHPSYRSMFLLGYTVGEFAASRRSLEAAATPFSGPERRRLGIVPAPTGLRGISPAPPPRRTGAASFNMKHPPAWTKSLSPAAAVCLDVAVAGVGRADLSPMAAQKRPFSNPLRHERKHKHITRQSR
jgi:hypothetical protein